MNYSSQVTFLISAQMNYITQGFAVLDQLNENSKQTQLNQ